MSINSTSPSSLFGGFWTPISQGRSLIGVGELAKNSTSYYGSIKGVGTNFSSEEAGGEDYHGLTVSEMPSHSHGGVSGNSLNWQEAFGYHFIDNETSKGWGRTTLNMSSAGGSQYHNNMPPYFAVYMWKRVS